MEVINTTPTQERFVVKDQSFVGSARRSIRTMAEHAGLTGEPLARLDIISTELATNLAKHANGGGEIIAMDISSNEVAGIRLLSLDTGPGISEVHDVLVDGFSTTGTMGGGLGALKRQSDFFEISSAPNKGTAIHCAISQSESQKPSDSMEIGALSLPHPREKNCGDGVAAFSSDGVTSILVIDGLGHGDGAAEVVTKALYEFNTSPFEEQTTMVEKLHKVLAGTRGAALALVRIDQSANQLNFVGVGNITCRMYSKYSSKGFASIQGVVGERIGSLKQFSGDWSSDSGLLMYSDGIKSAASLSVPQTKTAILEAAEIYRDHSRTTDDTTVVVVRDKRRK